MKKILFILLLTVTSFLSTSAREYHRTIGDFTSISVVDSIPVVYRCVPDSAGSVAFDADPEVADAIFLQVRKGELKISISTEYVFSRKLPTLYVYSDFLQKIYNSSNATVRIFDPAPVPQFSAKLIGNGNIEVEGIKATTVKAKVETGNGQITLQGECNQARLNLTGTGTIQADLLKAKNVDCNTVGTGTIGCWPEISLKTRCLGSTKFYYKGDPAINKRGGGKLIRID